MSDAGSIVKVADLGVEYYRCLMLGVKVAEFGSRLG